MIWQLTFWIGGALALGALACTDTRYELGRSAFAVNTLAPAVVFALVGYVVARRDALAAARPTIPLEALQNAEREWFVLLPVVGIVAVPASFALYRGDGSEVGGVLALPFAPLVAWLALLTVPPERRGGVDWIARGRREGVATTLLAMTPLLLPLAMHLALRDGELTAPWSERIAPVGTSGLAYHAELPWRWTTALLAAWGLDRFLGWPRSAMATWVTGAVVAATLVLGVVLGLERDDLGVHVRADLWTNAPRGHLPHVVPLLHVAAGLAVALALSRPRRTLRGGLATALVVLLAFLMARVAIPDHGPWIAADIAAGAAVLLATAQAVLARRGTG